MLNKQNVIEQMKSEKRRERAQELASFALSLVGVFVIALVLWALLWSGCALVDSCYQANI